MRGEIDSSLWNRLLITFRVPLFHKMHRREYRFVDPKTGDLVYKFYDPYEDKMYLATHERARFRVSFDELAYKEPVA